MAIASSPVLFENPAGQLAADPAGFMRMTWSGAPRTLADTQGLLTHLAQALRQRGWAKVLANQIDMRSFSPTEQEWISQEWLPQAVHTGGYRYGAIVVSTDTYARLATAFITTSVQGLPMRYRSFDQEAEAAAWLAQQPSQAAGR
ncbi:MAG: STAS/SEC14 domain-containing protein [Cytophagaceae bacterium]|nr:MAG: STAS/SEC14 domain-containing protein [Cytophagaceae bacterium]